MPFTHRPRVRPSPRQRALGAALLVVLSLPPAVQADTAKAAGATSKGSSAATKDAAVQPSPAPRATRVPRPRVRKARQAGKLPDLSVPTPGEPLEQRAPGAQDARRRAMVALNTGRYEEAISAFEQAYTLDQDPILLFRLAQAYRLAGQPSKALEACESYLRAADERAVERGQAERFLAEMEMIAYQLRLQREYGVLPPPRPAATQPAALALQPPAVGEAARPATPLPLTRPSLDASESSPLTKAPTPAPLAPSPPFYRRAPFWVAVGGAVVAGAAVVWFTQRSHGARAPHTALGYQQAFP